MGVPVPVTPNMPQHTRQRNGQVAIWWPSFSTPRPQQTLFHVSSSYHTPSDGPTFANYPNILTMTVSEHLELDINIGFARDYSAVPIYLLMQHDARAGDSLFRHENCVKFLQ